MAMHKVRFTLWMEEEVLRAAKVRAAEEGVTSSRVIAAAARTVLLETPKDTDARILQAVERVFALIQRIDRRRGYDQQVLKEMVGLMVQSFFNHTPAVPEKDKKAALHSGKARFNRFLDALAANLRAGQSIMNDLPASMEPAVPELTAACPDSISETTCNPDPHKPAEMEPSPTAVEHGPLPSRHGQSNEQRRERPASKSAGARWSLFG